MKGNLQAGTSTLEKAALTDLQGKGDAGLFAQSMAGYVKWLAQGERLAKTRESIKTCQTQWRTLKHRAHSRTPDNLAQLDAGLKSFIAYALDSGAISEEEAKCLLRDGELALRETVDEQQNQIRESDPAVMFFELLGSGLRAGRCHLASMSGDVPNNPRAMGWRVSEVGFSPPHPMGETAGWVNETSGVVYLNPTTATTLVRQISEASGTPVSMTSSAMGKLLKERGKLAETDPTHTGVKRVICGNRQRVWAVSLNHLLEGTDAPEDDFANAERTKAVNEKLEELGFSTN